MASAKRICRVCGKEYEACRSANRRPGVFYWQEVACSPECGQVYLRRVEEARGIGRPKKEKRRRLPAEEPVKGLRPEIIPVAAAPAKVTEATEGESPVPETDADRDAE